MVEDSVRCVLQDVTTQAACKPCEPSYFCVANSTTYTDQRCPSGHYCPEATRFDVQFPCPIGTFNNLTRENNLTRRKRIKLLNQ